MRYLDRAVELLCVASFFVLCGCPGGGGMGGGGNVAPVAEDQSVDVMIDTPEDISLVATDGDNGPQALTFSIVTQPTAGTLSAMTGNQVTYTPNPQFAGLDRFTFTAFDGEDTSNEAEVCIEVTATPQDGSTNDCSSIGGGGGDGGGGGSGGGDGGEDDDLFTLTLNILATARTGVVRVVGYENQPNITRADTATTAWDFDSSYSMGNHPGTSSQRIFSFAPGTQITLVADELNVPGVTLNASVILDLNDTTLFPSIPAQFVEWGVSEVGTAEGSDKGILHFTMDRDRTIDAVFQDMNALRIGVVGGVTGTGTTVDMEIMSTPLTIPPEIPQGFTGGNIVGTIFTGQAGEIGIFGFYNDGTVVTFTVPAPAPFTSWSGDGAISGRSITLTFGQGTEATLTFP